MYHHKEVEQKWQSIWAQDGAFIAQATGGPKYYVLDMFPYPSGIGLHVGHLKGYVASDVVARYKRAQGFEVLHPMGWDSFGLPTERQAQKEGIRPEEVTRRNVVAFRKQLDAVGLSYDWSREIATSDPAYYRWTQWIFCKLHERGLAYRKEMTVNWCPALRTVLANEEVLNGRYVETGDPVERRTMKQWMLRITAYAERLLSDLNLVEWPQPIKRMQQHWIGRSEGAAIHFSLCDRAESLEVFTTRPDTIFGVTYMVVAPEHWLIHSILESSERAELRKYVEEAKKRSDVQRQERVGAEPTGAFSGIHAINPATGERIPVWTSEYVLGGYGTAAVMGVPAHDERDFEFAARFSLPVRRVVVPEHDAPAIDDLMTAPYIDAGRSVNSASATLSLDGLETAAAREAVVHWLEATGTGKRRVHYKLRDWLFSRQRYWGEPFPVLYGPDGEVRIVEEQDLPVELPFIDLSDNAEESASTEPTSPLGKAPLSWLVVEVDGKTWTRETNTMPQWAGSCWYYLRFLDPQNKALFCAPDKERYWMPVDLYVGGAEHATLHLLYARFWHKVLYDLGLVTHREPFQRLFNQGMIHANSFRDSRGKYYYPEEVEQCGEQYVAKSSGEKLLVQVEKMSKSKCNGVAPELVIDKYGADALRLYEVFMGPVEEGGLWDGSGVKGTRRFLERLWTLFDSRRADDGSLSEELERELHRTIRAVTEDIEALHLNTAVSRFMSLLNLAYRQQSIATGFFDVMARLLQPFAPHFAEEMWSRLGNDGFVFQAPWPEYNEQLCTADTVTVAIQINGRTRGTVDVTWDASKDDVVTAARGVLPQLAEQATPGKAIYVPGRIINFVFKAKR